MNIVVIVIDRLHAGYLGCFGNTWVSTPAFDRLAAEGFVFQQAIIDSPDLADAYEAMWRGTHAAERAPSGPEDRRTIVAPTLAELARKSGARTILLSDEPSIGDHPAAAAFDETAELEGPGDESAGATGGETGKTDDDGPASEVEKTHAARFFAEASEYVATEQDTAGEPTRNRPFFLWLHTRGLGGAWDAPYSFRERYVDEDDPPAPTFTHLESRRLPADVDLDERFGLAQAYAGQVTLWDLCLGGFLARLDETGLADDTAVMVVSPRGIALGEHDDVGTRDERLHAEIVHVPWLLRLPKSFGRLRRTQALVQPCDIYHTLSELLGTPQAAGDWGRSALGLVAGGPIEPAPAPWRDRAVVCGAVGGPAAAAGIRTAAWYLLEPAGDAVAAADDSRPAARLYAKPDDWWEVNDVADRCPEIVERLSAVRRETMDGLAAGKAVEPLAADDPLVVGLS